MQSRESMNRSSSFVKDGMRVIVLGVGTVGKSSITLRFTSNTFTGDYVPTVQDTFRKNTMIDGDIAQLEILDTAGQEDYVVMQDLWIKQGKGFLLVYSIDNKDSFTQIDKIYKKILKIRNNATNIPIILCANKIDLIKERVVESEEGQEYANKIGAQYIETSAKLGQNCNYVFESLVRKIRQHDKPEIQILKKKKSFWDKCQLI